MNSMILNGIEMPLVNTQASDNEQKLAENLLTIVSEAIEETDSVGTELSVDPNVNVYDIDPNSSFDREYYSVTIYGGKNGSGIWSNYFKSLSDLMLRIEDKFEDAWIISLDVDTIDDVWAAQVGIYPYEGQI